MMKFIGWFFNFMGGFVACMHLSFLVPINKDFEASWLSLIAAFLFSIIGACIQFCAGVDYESKVKRW